MNRPQKRKKIGKNRWRNGKNRLFAGAECDLGENVARRLVRLQCDQKVRPRRPQSNFNAVEKVIRAIKLWRNLFNQPLKKRYFLCSSISSLVDDQAKPGYLYSQRYVRDEFQA